MLFSQTLSDSILTVAPEGRLDSATSGEFSDYLGEHFTEEMKGLILDFSRVDFISSKGLRVLVTLYKQLNGRTLEITGANTSVQEAFYLSGFTKIFRVSGQE